MSPGHLHNSKHDVCHFILVMSENDLGMQLDNVDSCIQNFHPEPKCLADILPTEPIQVLNHQVGIFGNVPLLHSLQELGQSLRIIQPVPSPQPGYPQVLEGQGCVQLNLVSLAPCLCGLSLPSERIPMLLFRSAEPDVRVSYCCWHVSLPTLGAYGM